MIGFKKNIFKQIKNISKRQVVAFTLVEVLISVTLFSGIILTSTSLFKLSIDAQRNAIATQNVQESLKYFLEMIAKEIRTAQKNEGVCPVIPSDQIFVKTTAASGDVLIFKNYYDECVEYSIGVDSSNRPRFKIKRTTPEGDILADFISPSKIEVSALRFVLNTEDPANQPAVMINIKANAIGDKNFESELTLQTTVTSRYYK